MTSALETLTGLTNTLKSKAKTRRDQDNLIFARIKEDRDFELNKNRESRFTVTGLVTSTPPLDAKERKEFFRLKLAALVEEACPDSELDPKPEVLDVYVNMRYGQDSPFLEGRMNTAAASSAFRVAASQLAKDESPNFKGLFIANAVTLATRVRIEILRAISKTLISDDTESFVQGFSSRPLLHYHMRDHCFRQIEGTNRTYSFVEAVAKFGDNVSQADLIPSYRRARPAFIGCMEQYFVVLREGANASELVGASGSNQRPVGSRGSRGGWGSGRGGGTSYSGSGRSRGGRQGRGGHRGRGRGLTPNRSDLIATRLVLDPRKRRLSDDADDAFSPSKRGSHNAME